jgi:hypothetical protein
MTLSRLCLVGLAALDLTLVGADDDRAESSAYDISTGLSGNRCVSAVYEWPRAITGVSVSS